MLAKLLRLIPAALFPLFIVACSGQHALLNKNEPLFPSGQGAIVASFASNYPKDYGATFGLPHILLSIDSISNPENGSYSLRSDTYVVVNSSFMPSEGTQVNSNGGKMLLTKALPPGDYAVTRETISFKNYSAYIKLTRTLPFTVRANQLTYIGSLVIGMEPGQTIFGTAVPGRVFTSIRDGFTDDSALLYRIRPEVQSLQFNDAVRGARLPDQQYASSPPSQPDVGVDANNKNPINKVAPRLSTIGTGSTPALTMDTPTKNDSQRIHLSPADFINKTMIYNHPRLAGVTVQFTFTADKVFARNSNGDSSTGTWSLNNDVLCADFIKSTWRRLCFHEAEKDGQVIMVMQGSGKQVPFRLQ